MFAEPKNIAQLLLEGNDFLQKIFIDFYKRHFKTGQTNSTNDKICTILG